MRAVLVDPNEVSELDSNVEEVPGASQLLPRFAEQLGAEDALQGYLAHKKPPPP